MGKTSKSNAAQTDDEKNKGRVGYDDRQLPNIVFFFVCVDKVSKMEYETILVILLIIIFMTIRIISVL